MKKSLFSLFVTSLIFCSVQAQDYHFSQFYASPLNLNPALTGAFSGKYRVSMINRDQWRGVTSSPFSTFSGAIDLRFNANEKKVMKDAASVGMVFSSDRANIISYNANNIMLSGAYSKSLNVDNSQYLTAGYQVGIGQRNLNLDNFDYEDEFNGKDGYTGQSNEKFPLNNFAYPDMAFGLSYSIAPKRNSNITVGGAVHHLLEPNISFFDEETEGGTKRLDRKYSAHASAQLPINYLVSFSPRAFVAFQGSHAQLNLGTNFRMQFSDYGTTALHMGGWMRGVRNEKSVGIDAAALMLGFELNNFLLGLSYDLNLKGISAYSRNQGAFEISLGYLGDYDNDTILCPKF